MMNRVQFCKTALAALIGIVALSIGAPGEARDRSGVLKASDLIEHQRSGHRSPGR